MTCDIKCVPMDYRLSGKQTIATNITLKSKRF